MTRANVLQHVEAVAVGQRIVEHDHVNRPIVEQRQRAVRVRRTQHVSDFLVQRALDQLRVGVVVFDE